MGCGASSEKGRVCPTIVDDDGRLSLRMLEDSSFIFRRVVEVRDIVSSKISSFCFSCISVH